MLYAVTGQAVSATEPHKLAACFLCRDNFEGQLDYDLGNLMACDPSPQDAQALTDNREVHSLETATLITQSLVARLFALPGRLAAFGRIVDLPGPAFQLPRQKPLPKPRPPTRQGFGLSIWTTRRMQGSEPI